MERKQFITASGLLGMAFSKREPPVFSQKRPKKQIKNNYYR
jgi:hypothetical protein